MSIADLRQDLADSFIELSANIYSSVPEAPIAPAIVIVPDSPYMVPNLINKSVTKLEVNLVISCAVAYNSNAGSLDNLEQLTISVLGALPAGYVVRSIERPTVTQVGASNLLVSDISVTTYYAEGA